MDKSNFGALKDEIAALLNPALLRPDMEAAELFDVIADLNKMAITDSLTGLYNRRFLTGRLPEAYHSCIRLNKPFSLAMMDVDDFKRTNDEHGHLAGDAALKHIAESILVFIRSDTDFAVRYGGDEFLICFPGAEKKACADICERIRNRINKKSLRYSGRDIHISVSVGVASGIEVPTIEGLIAAADKRLYTAKASGRNCVIY